MLVILNKILYILKKMASNPENIANEVFDNTPEIQEENETSLENNIEEDQTTLEKDGNSVEEDGNSVEEDGNSVEEDGNSVEEDGNSVEEDGNSVEEDGNSVEEDGNGNSVEENNTEEIIQNEEEKNSTLNVAKNNAINAINTLLENINSGLINMNSLFNKKNKKQNKINGNIQEMISYQDKLYEDEKYLEYLNYLKLFYELDNKQSIYKKSYENNKLVLTSKDKRIVITPSVVVDLDNYKNYLEKEIHNMLFNILQLIENYSMNNQNQKDEFNKFKNSYVLFKAQLNDIQNIEKNYFEKISKFEEEIAKLEVELNNLKENRVSIYSKINTKIINETKEKLILSFKDANNKIPTPETIKQLSNETQIQIEDIELWLQWIEKSYLYLNGEQKYSQLIKERFIEEENFKNLTKNFILQKPNIEFS